MPRLNLCAGSNFLLVIVIIIAVLAILRLKRFLIEINPQERSSAGV